MISDVIGEPKSLAKFVEQAQPGIIKYLDPTKPVLLAPITVGRIHSISEEKELSVPEAVAQRHADIVSVRSEQTGIMTWEGLNEPGVTDADYIARLVDYELYRTQILNSRGLGAVVLNLSVGWPQELEGGTIDWEPFRELLEDLSNGNYLGLHEYWLPSGPRHPDSYQHRAGRLGRCPFEVPILVTECGVDIGGGQDDGWRAQGLTVEQYVSQLGQYRDMLATDARVKGATIFTYGNKGEWAQFDIEPDWLRFAPVCRPVESVKPKVINPIRVLYQGKVLILELEEYLRGVVPAEMPGLWNMEALKAQAVAARSYAIWRRVIRDTEGFDLYADARDQVYNPHKIHERTDQAIQATAGLYLLRDGEVFVSRYVSKCGRADCLYCDGENGYDDKPWHGRGCQYGFQHLAKLGYTFREILREYYGTLTYSDGGGIVGNKTLWKDPMTDAHQVDDSGRVVGSRVDILKAEDVAGHYQPLGPVVYRVVSLRFIDEEQARGDTRIKVTVLDRDGQVTMAKVVNAWPQQKRPRWDEVVYDWASPAHVAEFAQGGGNYDPSKDGPLGPYVIYVEQNQEKQLVASDWCIGFGLPGNRHVAYEVTYQECLAYTDDVDVVTPPEPVLVLEENGCNLILAGLMKLLEALKR